MTNEEKELELSEDDAPEHLTPKEILSLRRAGLPRPSNISRADWMSPTKLNSTHELVAYMSANGVPKTQISEACQIPLPRLALLLKSGRVAFRIREIQFALYGKEPKRRFEAMMHKSFQVVSDLLEDDRVKPATKLNAANSVFDRVMGKPTQSIDIRDSTLKDFYDLLDKKFGEAPAIEAEFTSAVPPNDAEKPEIDQVDDWVKENL